MTDFLGDNWLSIANTIGLVVLWAKTNVMCKLLFLIGAKLGWCDEKGHPTP